MIVLIGYADDMDLPEPDSEISERLRVVVLMHFDLNSSFEH